MQREKINTFLVNAFNTILQLEDRALSSSHEFSNLSVSEFHVIEAVIACGENSSMSAISKRLGITVGSLTVAVKTLANKGYLKREKRMNDMRMVYVIPTEKGWLPMNITRPSTAKWWMPSWKNFRRRSWIHWFLHWKLYRPSSPKPGKSDRIQPEETKNNPETIGDFPLSYPCEPFITV